MATVELTKEQVALQKARAAYEAAAKVLQEATRAAFPVGSIVRVRLGRADVELEVTGAGHHWFYQPDYVSGVNTRTGKRRRFWSGDDDVRIVTKGGGQDR